MQLAARLSSGPILVAPGVYDPLSALIAQQAGAEAVFVSGAMAAMAQQAMPDIGLMTATELIDLVARIADRLTIPVFVDGDQGFGNAAHVQRLVRGLCRAGAAAVQIEDQIAVKPANALAARTLVSAAEMVGKIKAALDARQSEQFLISARTDTLWTRDINEALDRAELYVAAGCDLLFVESIRTRQQAEAIVSRFGGRLPLVHNLLKSGGSPFADASAAAAAGFALALFPATALGAAAHSLNAAYRAILADGTDRSLEDRVTDVAGLNAIVGTSAIVDGIARYGGTLDTGTGND